MPTLALMYVAEDVDAPFLLDAALEYAGGAALDELIVDDAVGGRPALHFPSFGLVHGRTPFYRNSDIGRDQDGAATTAKSATRVGSGSAALEPG